MPPGLLHALLHDMPETRKLRQNDRHNARNFWPQLIRPDQQRLALARVPSLEQLCAKLPASRGLVRVEVAGHSSNLTHPDLVNRAIEDFLASL